MKSLPFLTPKQFVLLLITYIFYSLILSVISGSLPDFYTKSYQITSKNDAFDSTIISATLLLSLNYIEK